MTKAEFLKRLMLEAEEHWNQMQDAYEDGLDEEFNPQAASFANLMATFSDCRAELWREESEREQADAAIINARLANPYR